MANRKLLTLAQNYLPTVLGGKPAEPGQASSVKNNAVNLYATAVSTIQPHLQTAQAVVTVDSALPPIETVKAKVQDSGFEVDVVEGSGPAGQKSVGSNADIPSTSTPLEGGPNTESAYPTTITIGCLWSRDDESSRQNRNWYHLVLPHGYFSNKKCLHKCTVLVFSNAPVYSRSHNLCLFWKD